MERSDSRNTTIDLFRLIATFGVITIHVPFSTPAAKIYFNVFWPFCVPFFYMASLTFYFINLENFSSDLSTEYSKLFPGYGLGLRIRLNKYSGANLCVDYGFGQNGSHGFFVNLGEVF